MAAQFCESIVSFPTSTSGTTLSWHSWPLSSLPEWLRDRAGSRSHDGHWTWTLCQCLHWSLWLQFTGPDAAGRRGRWSDATTAMSCQRNWEAECTTLEVPHRPACWTTKTWAVVSGKRKRSAKHLQTNPTLGPWPHQAFWGWSFRWGWRRRTCGLHCNVVGPTCQTTYLQSTPHCASGGQPSRLGEQHCGDVERPHRPQTWSTSTSCSPTSNTGHNTNHPWTCHCGTGRDANGHGCFDNHSQFHWYNCSSTTDRPWHSTTSFKGQSTAETSHSCSWARSNSFLSSAFERDPFWPFWDWRGWAWNPFGYFSALLQARPASSLTKIRHLGGQSWPAEFHAEQCYFA